MRGLALALPGFNAFLQECLGPGEAAFAASPHSRT